MKYLKKFDNYASYEEARKNLILPNVSLCEQENEVHYNPYVPPFFCKLALNNGETVKLEGNGELTSAMTSAYSATVVSAEIGELCTSIGNWAFGSCSGLTSIDIPNSVTRIGDYTFYGCSGLTSIDIPDSVTSIGYSAFQYCTGLTSCTIGSGVTSISGYAFNNCRGLTSINVDGGNTNFSSEDGVLFNKAKTTLIQYPNGNLRTSYTIPSSVTSIGTYAFQYCRSLTSIDIPDSVTDIDHYAFDNCSGLTSIDIPDSVTGIGSSAFGNCSSLVSVTIGSGVTIISSSAFGNCSSLVSVTIGNSVTSIGGLAFSSCRSLTSIVCNATTAPKIYSGTFRNIKTGGTLKVPSGSSGYDVWMGTGDFYLGKYNWTKVEQ